MPLVIGAKSLVNKVENVPVNISIPNIDGFDVVFVEGFKTPDGKQLKHYPADEKVVDLQQTLSEFCSAVEAVIEDKVKESGFKSGTIYIGQPVRFGVKNDNQVAHAFTYVNGAGELEFMGEVNFLIEEK